MPFNPTLVQFKLAFRAHRSDSPVDTFNPTLVKFKPPENLLIPRRIPAFQSYLSSIQTLMPRFEDTFQNYLSILP